MRLRERRESKNVTPPTRTPRFDCSPSEGSLGMQRRETSQTKSTSPGTMKMDFRPWVRALRIRRPRSSMRWKSGSSVKVRLYSSEKSISKNPRWVILTKNELSIRKDVTCRSDNTLSPGDISSPSLEIKNRDRAFRRKPKFSSERLRENESSCIVRFVSFKQTNLYCFYTFFLRELDFVYSK